MAVEELVDELFEPADLLACGAVLVDERLEPPEAVRAGRGRVGGGIDRFEAAQPAFDIDQVFGMRLRHGLGFGLQIGDLSFAAGQMFWGGLGGSLAVIDLDTRASVAFVMNRMAPDALGDPRGTRIIQAALASL